MDNLKSFVDLVFSTPMDSSNSKHAIMEFENGYKVSVVLDSMAYSNGVNTYEVAVQMGDEFCKDIYPKYGIITCCTEDMVTDIMIKVQELYSLKHK